MRLRHRTLLSIALALYITTLQAAEVISVDVYNAKQSRNSHTLSLTGTVETKQHASLATLQSGVVAALFVEVGDSVKKGQKLLALDAKLAELTLLQVEASKSVALVEKTEAERLYNEVISLSKQQLVAETLLAERRSRLEVAKAELGRVNAELTHQQEVVARHSLYAPFSGIIAHRQIDLGEWVTPQTAVLTLVDQSHKRLNIAIPQEYFNQLNSKQNVEVLVTPDFTDSAPISASLDRLVGVASNSSRTVIGLVELPSAKNWVVGMSARADITLPMQEQSLVWLPKAAIKQHPDGGSSVFIVNNNRAKRILVKVEATQAEQVAISGASADKPFVISGIELLRDGDALTVKNVSGSAL